MPHALPPGCECGKGKPGQGLLIRVLSRIIKIADKRVKLKRRKQVSILEDNKVVNMSKRLGT